MLWRSLCQSPRSPLRLWHDSLGLPHHSRDWHRKDVLREVVELRGSQPWTMARWSELADIAYPHSRAAAAGFAFRTPMRSSLVSQTSRTGACVHSARSWTTAE